MAGGKLTGYRKMAEKLLDDVSKTLAKETGKSIKQFKQNIYQFLVVTLVVQNN